MRRIDPLHLAFTAVACLLPLGYVLPETFVGEPAEGRLDAPKCEVPPGRPFVVDYFGVFYAGDTTNLIDRYVLCVGSWERHVLEILGQSATAAAAARGASADELVFVDVGANTGLHSIYMAQRVGTVHAFDPHPGSGTSWPLPPSSPSGCRPGRRRFCIGQDAVLPRRPARLGHFRSRFMTSSGASRRLPAIA